MSDCRCQIIKKYSSCEKSPIPLPVGLIFQVLGGIAPTNEIFPADTDTKIFDDGVRPPRNPFFDREGWKMIKGWLKSSPASCSKAHPPHTESKHHHSLNQVGDQGNSFSLTRPDIGISGRERDSFAAASP